MSLISDSLSLANDSSYQWHLTVSVGSITYITGLSTVCSHTVSFCHQSIALFFPSLFFILVTSICTLLVVASPKSSKSFIHRSLSRRHSFIDVYSLLSSFTTLIPSSTHTFHIVSTLFHPTSVIVVVVAPLSFPFFHRCYCYCFIVITVLIVTCYINLFVPDYHQQTSCLHQLLAVLIGVSTVPIRSIYSVAISSIRARLPSSKTNGSSRSPGRSSTKVSSSVRDHESASLLSDPF